VALALSMPCAWFPSSLEIYKIWLNLGSPLAWVLALCLRLLLHYLIETVGIHCEVGATSSGNQRVPAEEESIGIHCKDSWVSTSWMVCEWNEECASNVIKTSAHGQNAYYICDPGLLVFVRLCLSEEKIFLHMSCGQGQRRRSKIYRMTDRNKGLVFRRTPI
jgi:hypothetical protein